MNLLDEQLMAAVRTRDTDQVSSLLDQGASVHARDGRGNTPLHEAVIHSAQQPAGILALLERGADPHATNEEGRTPLYFLAHYHQEAACLALIAWGVDVSDERHRFFNKFQSLTQVEAAVRAGNAQLLLRALDDDDDEDTLMQRVDGALQRVREPARGSTAALVTSWRLRHQARQALDEALTPTLAP